MLVKFAVTNYRGFEDTIELDLGRPREYEFNSFAIRNSVVKNGIIYGPNGCGKSNLGLAIFDIVNHLSQKWKRPDYYANFVFAGATTRPVAFLYVFHLGEDTLEYTYSKDKSGQLLEESLVVNSKEIFNRKTNSFAIDASFPMDDAIKRNLENNANKVSIINFILTSYPLPENHYLVNLQKFVNFMLWFKNLDERSFIGLETHGTELNDYIIKNNLVKDFAAFLEKVSGQHFDFVSPNRGDKMLQCFIKGSPVLFNSIISTGTNALLLLYYWIQRMDEASFVFIDEFDAFYHFKLAYEVCNLLFKKDCQVLLSSHNTYLMTNDLLRPDCNFILDKNRIKPLCDCTEKDLRFGHNIEKLFRGDTFIV